MSLSIGIVGLPNVGKSTLFNAITKNKVSAENYPFCTIDPSVGVVSVHDERIDRLSDFSKSGKKIYAAVEFVDIAGLVAGASEGEGLGNKFLSNIREVDAIAQIVRIFEDSNITHVSGDINPLRDIKIINMELILTDIQTVNNRFEKIEKDIKKNDKDAIFEKAVLSKVLETLEKEKFVQSLDLCGQEKDVLKSLHLLTNKPILYVLNRKAGGRNLDELHDTRFDELISFLKSENSNFVFVDAGVEQELSELDEEDKQLMRVELDVGVDDGVQQLINESYKMLDLITFFTTGTDETRGWTVRRDSIAPDAGAVIHTDFRSKFIYADVINWSNLLDASSYGNARESGLIRTEGKGYVVQDGDVIEFRI